MLPALLQGRRPKRPSQKLPHVRVTQNIWLKLVKKKKSELPRYLGVLGRAKARHQNRQLNPRAMLIRLELQISLNACNIGMQSNSTGMRRLFVNWQITAL